jgi:hypothetical protein
VIDPFLKVRLGHFNGAPAVVLTDRTGAPFLWATGDTPLTAIQRMRAFCDEQERERKATT